MKKQYISPETLSHRLRLENMILSDSITQVKSDDVTNPIPLGGDAQSGGSDSRRYHDIWADEELDETDNDF